MGREKAEKAFRERRLSVLVRACRTHSVTCVPPMVPSTVTATVRRGFHTPKRPLDPHSTAQRPDR